MTNAVTAKTIRNTAASSSRPWDVVAHSSSLVVAAGAAIAIGQPIGWIAFLFPLGPVLVAALMRLVGAGTPRAIRSLIAFTIGSSLLVGGGWILTQAPSVISPLVFVFPLALLAFIVGLLNFVMITISRTVRAAKGQTFDYPWIPDRLARLVGLPTSWME